MECKWMDNELWKKSNKKDIWFKFTKKDYKEKVKELYNIIDKLKRKGK